MLDAGSISAVLDVYRPERAALVDLLRSLDADQWAVATECPAYSIKGIASHILGDDLSLLSRQRDGAEPGVIQVAAELPGSDFRTLLDAFNDRWVHASQFFSADLLLELLELAGEWTATYYEAVDPEAPGEFVGFFGGSGPTSPFWHAIAREFVERWVHHSQIRRALGRGPLADRPFLEAGVAVAAATSGAEAGIDSTGIWSIGPVVLGDSVQATDILTRGLTAEQVRAAVTGPPESVDLLASFAGRP